mgnify:CR=1 FL=1
MKKRLCILLISAALLLAGCGAAATAAGGLAFPKVSYDSGTMPRLVPEAAEKDSGESSVSTHDVSGSIAAMNAVPASRIYDLAVMDEGDAADDVAVIGFDDTEEARYSAPPLSSVSPDTEAIAATALDLLLQDDPPTPPETEMTIPFDIVKRAST